MDRRTEREPFAARLHFIPRVLVRPFQTMLVRAFHGYFERAPGWVLVTTRGRHTGLQRETFLPCARTRDSVIVISTYGWRSDWIRNLRKEPSVRITWAGTQVPAHAEIIEDVARKQRLVTEHPFFPAAPFAIVQSVALTVFRPLVIASLRRWVIPRPVVVISRDDSGSVRA
jgi:deazaflavin-dependent oxidoreductase (nitroreductase family)